MDTRNKITKRNVTIVLKRAELMYDIENIGYILHDTIQKSTEKDGHNLVDIGEEGNKDRVSRMLDLAYADMQRVLVGYLVNDDEADVSVDDILNDEDDYTFSLSINVKLPKSSVESVRTFMHEYMIDKVMLDWTSLVLPEQAGNWQSKLSDLETAIKGALTWRAGGTVIKVHPW